MSDTGSPGGFGTQGAGPPVDRFGNPTTPVDRFGNVIPTGAPPVAPGGFGQPAQQLGQFGAPVQAMPGYLGPPPAPARGGLPKWAIGLIVAGALVPVVGVIAAIAIPVFLNQRIKSELQATSISLPAKVGTLTLSTSDADNKIAAETVTDYSDGNVRDVVAGVYDDVDGSRTIVVAGRPTKPFARSELTTNARDLTLGFLNGAQIQSAGVMPVSTGSLGGSMSCGGGSGARGTWHACGALNQSSFILVASTVLNADNAEALAVREAVITKR